MENSQLGSFEDSELFFDGGPADGDEPDPPDEYCPHCEQNMQASNDLAELKGERMSYGKQMGRIEHDKFLLQQENAKLRTMIAELRSKLGEIIALPKAS